MKAHSSFKLDNLYNILERIDNDHKYYVEQLIYLCQYSFMMSREKFGMLSNFFGWSYMFFPTSTPVSTKYSNFS